MLVVLSPAKTLDFETDPLVVARSMPNLIDQTKVLVDALKSLTPPQLGELMSVSDELAELNHTRYQNFEFPLPDEGTKPALYAFRGDVYRGLDADRLTIRHVDYAEQHLRMLSGLYGVLRPLDAMLPYRLEMGTPLTIGDSKSLYQFWGSKITQQLSQDIDSSGSRVVLNLASKEYFKSVDSGALQCRVISPAFREMRDGKPTMITVYTKVARGQLASWVIRQRVRSLAKLKKFSEDGYRYNADLSTDQVPMFVR